MTAIPAFVPEALERLDIDVEPAVLQQLARYLDLLLKTNRKFNLTAVRDPHAAWQRHIVDSLTLMPWVGPMQPPARLVDVGSGGGLPGIPLAIACPHLGVDLLEATGKKARFLASCLTSLDLTRCRLIHGRAEEVGQNPAHRQRYDAAVCRAVGPMCQVLEYGLPLVRVGGRLLAIKGKQAEAELRQAQRAMDLLGAGPVEVRDAYHAGFESDSVIVAIEKSRPTPARYPRRPGVPRSAPL